MHSKRPHDLLRTPCGGWRALGEPGLNAPHGAALNSDTLWKHLIFISHRSALLADLGNAVRTPAEPSSPRRPSLFGTHAAPALTGQHSALSSYIRPGRASSAADSTSNVSPRRPSVARIPSMRTSAQHGPERSLKLSGTHTLEASKPTAQERWRSLGGAFPRSPSLQHPSHWAGWRPR